MDLKVHNVAVVGAGVIGLSSSLTIQEMYPSTNITLWADKFDEDTVSYGAGGIFRPEINVHPDSENVKKWFKDSLSYYLKMAHSKDGPESGMQLVSGYQCSTAPTTGRNELLQESIPLYRSLNEKELNLFPVKFKSGYFYTTVVIDCPRYLKWMKSKFEIGGGKIIKKHISSFDEIPANYDIIINCTGIGSKHLLQDDMMTPIRGQTIKVKAPWIKNFYYGDEVYIVPLVDCVLLGGVKEYGSWNTNVNTYQKDFIWDKCTELIPSLKKAEVIGDWVGLRPFRPSVRIDASFVSSNGSHRLIINNYGHGGQGIALSWGMAKEVTRMMQKIKEQKQFTVSKL